MGGVTAQPPEWESDERGGDGGRWLHRGAPRSGVSQALVVAGPEPKSRQNSGWGGGGRDWVERQAGRGFMGTVQ